MLIIHQLLEKIAILISLVINLPILVSRCADNDWGVGVVGAVYLVKFTSQYLIM